MGPWLLHYYSGTGKVLAVILVPACENRTKVRSHAPADQHPVLEAGHTLTWSACLCQRISFPPGEGSLQRVMYLSVDLLLKLVLKTAYTLVRCDGACVKLGEAMASRLFRAQALQTGRKTTASLHVTLKVACQTGYQDR